MTAQQHIDTLRTVIRLINDRRLDDVAPYISPAFDRHDLSGAFLADRPGTADLTNFLAALIEAMPDLVIAIEEVVAAEDARLTVRYRFTGTHRGPLFGIAPTGRAVDFSGINIYRFEQGQIREVWQLWDWATVFAQIGVLRVFASR